VGIGKVALNKIDIAISQDLTGVVLNQKLAIPDFIYWSLVNNANRLKALAQGSTIKGVLREDLGKMEIPLPSLPEQQKIAEILSAVDGRLELLGKRKERLGRIKKGLMDDLLTGKRRVKPDVKELIRLGHSE
jgi:type I restriction enzyme S subunit